MDIALEDDADDPIYLDALEEGVEQSLWLEVTANALQIRTIENLIY
jgi:hypothetical protein